MAENTDPCDDYACERPNGADHSHVGVLPHLRRVMDHGRLVDGKTGEILIAVSPAADVPPDEGDSSRNVEIPTSPAAEPAPGEATYPVEDFTIPDLSGITIDTSGVELDLGPEKEFYDES